MWTTPQVLILLATSHVLLLAVAMLRDSRALRGARLGVVFSLTVACHLLLSAVGDRDLPRFFLHLLVLGGAAVPFSFWLLTKEHFDEESRMLPARWAVLLALESITYLSWLVVGERRMPDSLFPPETWALWAVAPKLIALAILLHALLNVYVGARSDLLVGRLKLRYGVLAVAGSYLFFEALSDAVLRGTGAERLAERVHAATSFLLVFGLSAFVLRTLGELHRPQRVALDAAVADPALGERLRQLVEAAQVFREEGLTIASLAARLDTQEHKLRQLINSQLGFRNFNAFLHHFRIQEARMALSDPDKRNQNVAQIAYEVGYRSLGPFHKAFKETTGQTPTEFRASQEQRSLQTVERLKPEGPPQALLIPKSGKIS
jgi:AraC-like DNA-binding protein